MAQIHGSTEKILKTRDQNIQYYLQQQQTNPSFVNDLDETKKTEPDNISVASSMHFTVVNMNTSSNVKRRSFCQKHQLTVLVVTMSVVFTIGILAAIIFVESKCALTNKKKSYPAKNRV